MLLNLGSPDSFSVPDVRKYLNEFLMDERVIDYPWLFRKILVEGIITRFRAPKSAAAYNTIWTDRGSPLKVISEDFKNLAQQKVKMPISLAMRYGNPTPLAALKELESKTEDLDEILLAPMYPHYAMSSFESAVVHASAAIRSVRKDIRIKTLKPFYNEPSYIASLAESIKPYTVGNEFDACLFSYHGLPIRHLKKSDPTTEHCYASNDCCELKSAAWDFCYKHQVKETTKLVCKQLNLGPEKTLISFQSRLGSGWIEPFTDVLLEELPGKGVKKLIVVCPAFVADCLETLEEINDRGNEIFMKAGGEKFVAVPCLNTQPQWVETFINYCNGHDGPYAQLWNP